MKKTLSTILPYAVILTAAFYVLPWFARNTGAAMLLMLFIIPLVSFVCAVIYGIRHGFDFLFPIMTIILFAPTILIYYNSSAWLYIVVYGVIAFAGIGIGCIFHRPNPTSSSQKNSMKKGLTTVPSKKICRVIAGIMLLFAIGFSLFAITHPTASFPWSNTVTYSIYVIYVLIMVVLFVAPHKNHKKPNSENTKTD